MPRLALHAVLSVLPAAHPAGCGIGQKQPATLAPASSLFYGEVELKPGGDQQAAVDALARKFPGSGDAGQRLSKVAEDALREEDSKISFEGDIKPWLGDTVALFASNPGGGGVDQDSPAAALVATTDEDAALATVQKSEGQGTERDYQGVTYRRFGDEDEVAAVIDGFLVLTNERGLRSIVDAKDNDRTLEGSDRFQQALDDQPKDRLGFAYVDARSAVDAVPPSQAQFLAPFRRAFREPVVATLTAQTDALELTSKTPESSIAALGVTGIGSKGSDLIGQLPGDSILATGGPDLGRQLSSAVDLAASSVGGRAILEQGLRARTGLDLQQDVLGWMGDFGLFVRGQSTSSLGGGHVVTSTDTAPTRREIAGFQRIIRSQAGSGVRVGRLGVRGADAGFTLNLSGLQGPVNVLLAGDKFVLAFGNEAATEAINPGDTLATEQNFKQASQSLGSGYNVSFYASVPAALILAEGSGASTDDGYQRAKPYLTVLGALVGAAKPAGGGQLESKFRLTIPG